MVPSTRKETAEAPVAAARADCEAPALVLIFSDGKPYYRVFPLQDRALAFGRDQLLAAGIHDEYASRKHLLLSVDGERFLVQDEGSTNGTFLDGQRVNQPLSASSPAVIRIGRTLFLAVAQAAPKGLKKPSVSIEGGMVAGPQLQALNQRIARLASAGEGLLVVGESGTGKELAARRFHRAGVRPDGPFVAVNCATIPRDLAERLLFGTRRGAYSGATSDAEGYLQAAHGGTLFLDEIVELDLANQAKLLRALESREVQALGANVAQSIDVRVCAAAQRSLRFAVAEGRFREDLYFRIGRPELHLPPLRQRREEIPWQIEDTLQALAKSLPSRPSEPLGASALFVEACLIRPWPGNVRELRREVRSAALEAIAAERHVLEVQDLPEEAGQELATPLETPPAPTPAEGAATPSLPIDAPANLEPAALKAVLRSEDGNINRAAKRLGLHRSKLRRLIARFGLDIDALRRRDS